MGSKLYQLLFLLALTCSVHSTHDPDSEQMPSGYDFDLQRASIDEPAPQCKQLKPTARDVVKRIYAIMPYFDRERQNSEFLHKYRVTINMMSEGRNALDREAAFYATELTPIIFLHNNRDTWCLLERFQHALHQFQTANHSDKRNALKVLQNFRDFYHKIRLFIAALPEQKLPSRTTEVWDLKEDDNEIRDKKDIRYLKELIKNLG